MSKVIEKSIDNKLPSIKAIAGFIIMPKMKKKDCTKDQQTNFLKFSNTENAIYK